MYRQFRSMYDVDETVTNEHLRFSAQVAVAFDEVITRHDIYAFGFFWWGEQELVTQLRAQAALAVSRLASLGRPGVTEGDVKSAMGDEDPRPARAPGGCSSSSSPWTSTRSSS